MPTQMNLSGAYIEPNATDAVKQLAQLNEQWQAAHTEKQVVWSRLCGSSYDPSMVDRYNATTDLCSMFAQRIIQHKKRFRI